MDSSKFLALLLVEDDLGDQKLVKSALAAQEASVELRIVGSGEEGMRYLQRSTGGDAQSPRPSLILLDLNMPGMGGKEFLRCIKNNEALAGIPVVVLTTSDSDTDIEECYKLRAAGYIQKPGSIKELKKVVRNAMKYWSTSCLMIES